MKRTFVSLAAVVGVLVTSASAEACFLGRFRKKEQCEVRYVFVQAAPAKVMPPVGKVVMPPAKVEPKKVEKKVEAPKVEAPKVEAPKAQALPPPVVTTTPAAFFQYSSRVTVTKRVGLFGRLRGTFRASSCASGGCR